MRTGLALVAAGLLMGACGIFGPDEERVIATLSDPGYFMVRDSVAVGTAFTVTFQTQTGFCDRTSDTELNITGNIARITPYYIAVMFEGICPAALIITTREVRIGFNAIGEARVILTARHPRSGDLVELTEVVQVY